MTTSISRTRNSRTKDDPSFDCRRTFRVMDLFCGTGAIGFGLSQGDERFRTVFANDLDEDACDTTKMNHPGANVVCSSILDLDSSLLNEISLGGPIDLVIGGPPCQGFSSLRPSRGLSLDDERNTLYREFQRVVSCVQPRAFLMENVVGLVNATKGYLLADLLAGFEALGYLCDWKILNSAHYGVPQKRERFFLFGVRREILNGREISLPAPTHNFQGKTIGLRDKSRVVTTVDSDLPEAISCWDAISDLPSIRSGEASDMYGSEPLNDYQKVMRQGSRSLEMHAAANHGTKMLEVMKLSGKSKSDLPKGMVSSGYSSCYSRIDPDEPAPTVTVKFTSPASNKCIHPQDHRAITPREAARLQSFPDRFYFAGSKTSIASQIGNAVPPLFGAAFAPLIAQFLAEETADAR